MLLTHESTQLASDRLFNEWFAEPIVAIDNSVAGIIDALNRHPLADDQIEQD